MHRLLDAPRVMLPISVVVLWLSAHLGAYAAKAWRPPEGEEREDFTVVLTATFTLLGLIIGFSFSMAISRYDQRKNFYEAACQVTPQCSIERSLFRAHLQ